MHVVVPNGYIPRYRVAGTKSAGTLIDNIKGDLRIVKPESPK